MATSRRRKSNAAERKSGYMPTDVLFNILVRLPATSLQRLKPVNKQWSQAISDPELSKSLLAAAPFGLIFTYRCNNIYLEITVEPAAKDDFHAVFGYYPGRAGTTRETTQSSWHFRLPVYGTRVHGSCKGLLLFDCCSVWDGELNLIVANPITGHNLILPPFHEYAVGSCSFKSASIVPDPSNDIEFKVVVLGYKNGVSIRTVKQCILCGVLTVGSSNNPAWREVHIPFPIVDVWGPPVLAGGALHWRIMTGILSMDLTREEFHRTDITFLTFRRLLNFSTLLEWDGHIAVMYRDDSPLSYKIWILRDSRWTKLDNNLDITFFKCLCPFENFLSSDLPYPVASLKSGKIIIFREVSEIDNNFLAYDVGNQVMVRFGVEELQEGSMRRYQGKCLGNNDSGYLIPHVNSMVSC